MFVIRKTGVFVTFVRRVSTHTILRCVRAVLLEPIRVHRVRAHAQAVFLVTTNLAPGRQAVSTVRLEHIYRRRGQQIRQLV